MSNNRMLASPAVRITLAIAVMLVILTVYAGLYYALGVLDDFTTDPWLLQFNNIFMGAVLVAAVLIQFQRLDHKQGRDMGLGFRRKDLYFTLVVLLIAVLFVTVFIGVLHQKQILNMQFRGHLLKEPVYAVYLLLSCVGWFMAALKEEVLSRGYILYQLRRLGIWPKIWISAVLFMLIHFPTNGIEPYKALSYLFGGIAYAYIYLKSGSIWVATLTHAVHNYVNDLVFNTGTGYALLQLSEKVATSDKLLYEIALKATLLGLAYVFYGKRSFKGSYQK